VSERQTEYANDEYANDEYANDEYASDEYANDEYANDEVKCNHKTYRFTLNSVMLAADNVK